MCSSDLVQFLIALGCYEFDRLEDLNHSLFALTQTMGWAPFGPTSVWEMPLDHLNSWVDYLNTSKKGRTNGG